MFWHMKNVWEDKLSWLSETQIVYVCVLFFFELRIMKSEKNYKFLTFWYKTSKIVHWFN